MHDATDDHEFEQAHAEMVKRERLEWLAETMATLRDRELAEPGSLDDWAVMAMHASTSSWVTRVLHLDVPT